MLKMAVKLRENPKTRRCEFREAMRGMGPWGGVLYPLGMRVSPTRPHLGLCPPLIQHPHENVLPMKSNFSYPAFSISVARWFSLVAYLPWSLAW